MSISEAILFVATNSKSCVSCLNFVVQNRVPIQIVRLDTQEMRSIAANGKYFQINSVPTMVIVYQDGNTQLFLGAPKILQWLASSIKSGKPAAKANPVLPARASTRASARVSARSFSPGFSPGSGLTRIDRGTNMYSDEAQTPHAPGRYDRDEYEDEPDEYNQYDRDAYDRGAYEEDNDPVHQPRRAVIIEEDEPPMAPQRPKPGYAARTAPPKKVNKPVVVEEDDTPLDASFGAPESSSPRETLLDEDDMPPPSPVKTRKPKVSKTAKKSKGRRKKKGDVDDTEENPGLTLAKEKINRAASAKSRPLSSKMKDLYNAAKQMEEDRTSSLGYKESDLPRF